MGYMELNLELAKFKERITRLYEQGAGENTALDNTFAVSTHGLKAYMRRR